MLKENPLFQELVQDLYAFRDRFFETHPIELAKEKRKLVESKMNEVINQIDELSRKIFLKIVMKKKNRFSTVVDFSQRGY